MRYLFYYTLFFTFNFAQFNWTDDGAPIRQGLHIEWQRTGDVSADGAMIYAWSDCRNNGVRDVIAQKVDVNGNNLWGDNGVVAVTAEGRQEDPQLVTDGDGGAYIIWMDYRDETDAEGDIYAQHVLSDGSLAWPLEGYALTTQDGQQSSPNICSDGQGGAYVIWKDNASSSYGDIVATHLSITGVIAPGQGVPIITHSSYRSSPSLNTGGSGDAVLVWNDDRNSDEDIYAQRISVSGNTMVTSINGWSGGTHRYYVEASIQKIYLQVYKPALSLTSAVVSSDVGATDTVLVNPVTGVLYSSAHSAINDVLSASAGTLQVGVCYSIIPRPSLITGLPFTGTLTVHAGHNT